MLKNYLKIAYRNLLRFRGYTLINILGLSIGLSCCILILLFLKDELSYDRYHEKSDRIYRIVEEFSREGKPYFFPHTPAPLANTLGDYPEVLEATRFSPGRGDKIIYEDIQTRTNGFYLADPNVFEVFTIPLIEGNPENAIKDLYSVVISEDLARKCFGDENPTGRILQIGGEGYRQDYKVTGVFKNLPANSCLEFDCLASFEHNYVKGNEGNLTWRAQNYTTFVLLQENSVPETLEAQLPQMVEKYRPDKDALNIKYHLQSLTKIHLDLNPSNRLPTESESTYVYIFAGVALLILLIACINFMNLATARSSMREKEVGLRKVIGARRSQLINQFLGESIILSMLAFLLSIPIVETLLPVFNQYAGKELSFLHGDNIPFLAGSFVLVLFIGILAGSYPALFLSSFNPATIIKGDMIGGKVSAKTGVRRMLIVIQFVISIIFIACTLVMHNQLQYIRNKNLGYDKDHLVVIPMHDRQIEQKYALYKTEILRNVNIIGTTATSYLPSERGYHQNVYFKGPAVGKLHGISWISADQDFIKTMGLEVSMGEDFPRDFLTDAGMTYILNESAVKQIGWENPLGEQMDIVGWGAVVGVIQDFHFESLHHQIQPMALCIYPELFQYFLVRIKSEDISGSLRFLKDQWTVMFPDQPFEYSFLDEDFDRIYKTEIRLGGIFNFITALALLVACLGLFGLVSFSTDRRTKEVGIRKVIGASALEIVGLLTKEYTKWILIANFFSWPVAWYAMNKWLQNFAYRIDLTIWPFLLSGLLALIIALLTVSWQAIRAAMANPVESLRYE